MRARRWWVAPSAIALGASCGPVDPPPASPVRENSCASNADCAAYQTDGGVAPICSGTVCASSNVLADYTLVVSLPEVAPMQPGVTVAMAPSYIANPTNQCHPCFGIACPPCTTVPGAAQLTGSFVVGTSVQQCAGRPVDSGGASLPVDVQLWPLSSLTPAVGAASVGLPLLPVSGRAAVDSAAVSGPSGTPGTGWSVPQIAAGFYEEDLVPLDDAYPPQRIPLTLVSSENVSQNGTPLYSLDPGECPPITPPSQPTQLTTTFKVTRDSSLAGFSVYLRDATTLRRVSSLATLPDTGSTTVTLLTSGGMFPSQVVATLDLVIAPPAGAPIPTYADTILTQALTDTTFPSLPTPVTVRGPVRAPDGTPIDADLVIDSVVPSGGNGGIDACVNGNCSLSTSVSGESQLSYSTTTHATVAGGYAVALPPGSYDVFIIPSLGAAAGAASVPLLVQSPHGGITVADGETLTAVKLATISGVVQLADGRALVGATVEAHAAAALAAATPPLNDPNRWPRTVSALTDGAGAFSLSVDSGTYDVVVRPVASTGFPWVTYRSQSVGAGETLTISPPFSPPSSPLVVPVPILVDMTLENPDSSAASGAIVRAFAPSTTPLGTVQIELGVWLTDANGHFSMFMAPPQ